VVLCTPYRKERKEKKEKERNELGVDISNGTKISLSTDVLNVIG
jgi:hypothetical protein